MQITFLGTGLASCMRNRQTDMMTPRNGKNFFIDAGADLRWALADNGLSCKDVHAVCATHLHSDHMGGLEYLAFCTYFDPSMKDSQVEIIANSHLMRDMWNHSLQGELRSIWGWGLRTGLMDFFDVISIPDNGRFLWQDIEFEMTQSIHIMDGYSIVPSYGPMIHDPDTGKLVFITGDVQFCPNQIIDFYKKANLIIQDCETTSFKSGVHANYEELKMLPADIKAKMMLVHYHNDVVDSGTNGREEGITAEWSRKAEVDGFRLGFAVRVDSIDTKVLLGGEA